MERFKRLKSILMNLEDPILYTLAHDDQPISTRVDIQNVPENTLKTYAKYMSDCREKERLREKERKSDRWKGMQIGLGVGSLLLGALGLISKLMGWI